MKDKLKVGLAIALAGAVATWWLSSFDPKQAIQGLWTIFLTPVPLWVVIAFTLTGVAATYLFLKREVPDELKPWIWYRQWRLRRLLEDENCRLYMRLSTEGGALDTKYNPSNSPVQRLIKAKALVNTGRFGFYKPADWARDYVLANPQLLQHKRKRSNEAE